MIDLHLHTNSSDGTFNLEQLVKKVETAKLKAIAITDHDTVQSALKIKNLKTNIEVIPGIEISVYDNKLNYIDLHVLGLFIDPENPKLLSTLERLEKEREGQKRGIIKKLNKLGYDITYESAKKYATGSFGRPHIARALMEKYPDEFTSISDVFEKLLDQGKPAFRSRTAFFCLKEAISLIHKTHGIAILAHPMVYSDVRGYDLENVLTDFKGLGGDGIETVYNYAQNYPRHGYKEEDNVKITKKLQLLAKKFNFLESGGSDFHGPNKGAKLGTFGLPNEFLDHLKAARKPF
ncbi:PHP domain-containing protein [Candidatus Micrarchaeota archaeon]|nr:PHP domain-containing protein [Candidatus Micrarchaeota archaeon]